MFLSSCNCSNTLSWLSTLYNCGLKQHWMSRSESETKEGVIISHVSDTSTELHEKNVYPPSTVHTVRFQITRCFYLLYSLISLWPRLTKLSMNVCHECSPDCNGYTDLTIAAIVVVFYFNIIWMRPTVCTCLSNVLWWNAFPSGSVPSSFRRCVGSKLWSDWFSLFFPQVIQEHLQSGQRTMRSGKENVHTQIYHLAKLQRTSSLSLPFTVALPLPLLLMLKVRDSQ